MCPTLGEAVNLVTWALTIQGMGLYGLWFYGLVVLTLMLMHCPDKNSLSDVGFPQIS